MTQAAEEGLGPGATTQAAEEGLRAGVAEEEQAEETAETSEGAGRDRRAVLGLLGVGVSLDEEVGDVAQRRRCRRLPLPLGGAGLGARQGRRDRRAALGGPHRRGLHRVREMGERWIRRAGRGARKRGERALAERNRSLQGKVVEIVGVFVFVDRRGLQLYGLRWAMAQRVNSKGDLWGL